MATRKAASIEFALKSKGFRQDNTHHRMYWFYYDNKKTSIRTRLSHSVKEYGENLLKQIQKQMKFNTQRKLLDFIDCPLDEEGYVDMLRDEGEITA